MSANVIELLKAEMAKVQEKLRVLREEARRYDAAVAALLGRPANGAATVVSPPQHHRRVMSPAARRRIARAMKLRWAAHRRAGRTGKLQAVKG